MKPLLSRKIHQHCISIYSIVVTVPWFLKKLQSRMKHFELNWKTEYFWNIFEMIFITFYETFYKYLRKKQFFHEESLFNWSCFLYFLYGWCSHRKPYSYCGNCKWLDVPYLYQWKPTWLRNKHSLYIYKW